MLHPANTAEVSAAANCGPRGSIRAPAPTEDGRPAFRVDMSLLLFAEMAWMPGGTGASRPLWAGDQLRVEVDGLSGLKRSWVCASRQDIRHSDERTRQWSTARRLVSMVENMRQQ